MSTSTDAIASCPAFQTDLNNLFYTCNLGVDPITVVPFLYSDFNRTGIEFLVSPRSGKKRTVTAVYSQIIDDSEVQTKTGCDKTCAATTVRGDLTHDYSIDCGGYIIEGKFDQADWISSCTDNYTWINMQIAKMVASMENKLSKGIVSQLGPLVGNWNAFVANDMVIDADGYINVATLQSGGVNLNPTAWMKVDNAIRQTFCTDVFVGGGMKLYEYMQMTGAGCCMNAAGIDIAQMMAQYGRAVDYDQHVAATFGNDVSLAFQRGAIQILTLTHNMNGFTDISQLNVTGGNTYSEGIINGPVTGIPMDLTIKYDCGAVSVILEANAKAVGMPNDMFPEDHYMDGVTYLGGIQVVNP